MTDNQKEIRIKNKVVEVDYTKMIEDKHSKEEIVSINKMLMTLNYCFGEKNNFFNPKFDPKSFRTIYKFYDKLKTSILCHRQDLLMYHTINELKLAKYVFSYILDNTLNIRDIGYLMVIGNIEDLKVFLDVIDAKIKELKAAGKTVTIDLSKYEEKS